ncbi:MAG: DUF2946 family protein [Limnohabitans sp.]|nr:DUF2946 family protein [Limnohabitans sp.]
MDDIVQQAMAKWPNVPACTGWLGLDARGDWYMRDDRVQAMGNFLQSKGSKLTHEKLTQFIERNYMPDEQGRWFFQNGPQRVFVELEITPWIWRVAEDFSVSSHTKIDAMVRSSFIDENGMLYLLTNLGIGLVHTQDMWHASVAIENNRWKPIEIKSEIIADQFKFVKSPNINKHTKHQK